MQNNNITRAKKIIFDFLKEPEADISCTYLIGGSEEDNIVKCIHNSKNYVIKFFDNIDGKMEIEWTQLASDLKIGPKLYYSDLDNKYMLFEFVNGNTLIPEIANNHAVIKNIANNLNKLHSSSAIFANTSEIFERIDSKYKKLNCAGEIKEILKTKYLLAKEIEVKLNNFQIKLVPCHNDLNPGNIFVNNNKITLIDWGDSAIANPYYDIAVFFVLNNIKQENEELFFKYYQMNSNIPCKEYIKQCKKLVYFEFSLNLLLGAQHGKSVLLHSENIRVVNNIEHYLNHLAKRDVKVDTNFLYYMALAALKSD